jgi:4'-phosphopantetheinyl transferase
MGPDDGGDLRPEPIDATSLPYGDECVVWWVRPRPFISCADVLDAVERARAARMAVVADRDRFATGCWLLRQIVGRALGTTASAAPVLRRCDECGRAHGRPRIEGWPDLRVSVTHAGERVGLALTRLGDDIVVDGPAGCGVGLDVEAASAGAHVREVEADIVGESEQVDLPTDAVLRTQALLGRWVTKEAVLKAAGTGLRVEPRTVVLAGTDPLRLEQWPLEVEPERVHLRALHPGDGHVGALAVISGVVPRVREHLVDR